MNVYLVLALSLRLLFLYSFKGPLNTYLIYFTFTKTVPINKDLSQSLNASFTKGGRGGVEPTPQKFFFDNF